MMATGLATDRLLGSNTPHKLLVQIASFRLEWNGGNEKAKKHHCSLGGPNVGRLGLALPSLDVFRASCWMFVRSRAK